jgi:hypothetical protein
MIGLELKRCWFYILKLSLALAAIPLASRYLPKMVLEMQGGERRILSGFVFFFGLMAMFMIHVMTSNLFKAERRNSALEYMLTLPLGKWRLLGQKLAVRLMIVLPFWAVYMVLARFYLQNPLTEAFLFPLTHPLYMQFSLLFMLGSGFLLAAHEQKNWGAIVSLLLFYDLAFGTMAFRSFFIHEGWLMDQPVHQSGLAYALAVLVCLGLLVYPFMVNMKRFDLRAFARDSLLKRRALPLLGGFLVLSIVGLVWL